MWISTRVWLQDREDAIRLRLERDLAVQRAKEQENTLGWFMVRLTQVENERSKLIFNFTGVRVEAPVYEKDDPPIKSGPDNPLNAIQTFHDMGDDKALRDGYGWDMDGNLTLHGQRIN